MEPWDNEDAAWLRRQLNSKSGRKLMGRLKALTPVIQAKELEAMGIEGLRRQTWEQVIQAIEVAASHDEKPPTKETPFVNVNL